MGKKNILFLFADDMRYDTIAAAGNPAIITPNLDKLVRNGTYFQNAHIPGGTNGAVCMPSRAMLNTGKFLFELDNCGSTVPANHPLMGEVLKNAGYRTFGTGKWHNGVNSYARSFTDGDEIYFGGMSDHWNVPCYHFDPTGEYEHTYSTVMNPSFNNWTTGRRADHITLGKHSSDMVSDAACEFLDNYNSDKPFYMYVSYLAPHDPRVMPQKYLDMYNRDDIAIPENYMEEHPFNYGVREIRDEILAPYPRTKDEIKKHIHEYYAMITHLDDTVGKIIDSLKNAGKYEDTIIVFAADNGLSLGQHGLMGKQNNYEHSIRVPLVLSGPGIAKNEVRDSYVYLMDIFPTFCDLVGVDKPTDIDGISFAKVLENAEIRTRDWLFAVYENKVRSIKDYRYKIIKYKFEDLREVQLFDLQEDPYELNDLSKDPKMQQKLEELSQKLDEYAVKYKDKESELGHQFWDEGYRIEYKQWGIISGLTR